jgi:hypothetical protein
MALEATPRVVFQLRLPNATKRLLFTLRVVENALRQEEGEGGSCKRVALPGSGDREVGQILLVA